MHIDKLEESCFNKALMLVKCGMATLSSEMDILDLTETLIKMEKEKLYKDKLSDSKIYYNDEIISIEDVGDKETIDITVTGDNLFYCNDILVKNSFGTAATADLVFSIINTEELERLGQYQIKQLKNRLSDVTKNKRFNVGVDRSKMRLIDLGEYSADNLGDMESDRGIAEDSGEKFNKFSNFKF